MTLIVHSYCAYPSYREFRDKKIELTQKEWNAFKLIKAIKRKPFNKYADIVCVDGKTRRITEESSVLATKIAALWAKDRLTQLGLAGGLLIPIPSSSQTEFGHDCAPLRISHAINDIMPKVIVSSLLAFKQAREADHERSAAKDGEEKKKRQTIEEIYENLKCRDVKMPETAILVDDVCTEGRHVKACARFLRERGVKVEMAICVGQTIWENVEKPFDMPTRDLEPILSVKELIG